MRVLHFYKTYYPETFGGVQQVIYQLCTATQAQGIVSSVLTLSEFDGEEQLELDGHTIYRLKRDLYIASNDISFSVIKKFKELIKDFDLIHYHFPWPFMDIVHFLSGVNKPTVVTYHSDIVRQKFLLKLYTPIMKYFLKSVDQIVCTSPNYLESSEVLAKYKDKVSVIPIGLSKEGYVRPDSEKSKRLEHLVDKKFFLFLGIIRYYKGLHTLVEALAGLDYNVVIAGEGPLESELKKQASLLGLKNIHFIGKVTETEKIELLKACYAFLFPSHLRSEAFGISLLEAAMFSKPMVSCEIGTGTTYINIGDETGLVVPPNNVEAFKKAMTFLWENPTIAKEMGLKAGDRYNKLFTSQKMVSSYVDLYRKMK